MSGWIQAAMQQNTIILGDLRPYAFDAYFQIDRWSDIEYTNQFKGMVTNHL